METNDTLSPGDLAPAAARFWDLSAGKIRALERSCPPGSPSPVFTVAGRYTARGWTEWTQGFQYGSALLQFDATGDEEFLALGRERTLTVMAPHLTHTGVHDHGFNNVSTYGTLWRLIGEGRVPDAGHERDLYALALKVSGAVQASRWTATADGGGYVHSFNGPHSLFVDTVRSCRSLSLAHLLGHALLGEGDRRVSLLDRALMHLAATARHNVYYGRGRDAYDVRGRTVHESVFNVTDGSYRCPSTQQGYSPFSTWTRGLAWAVVGYPEQLEFLDLVPDADLEPHGGRAAVTAALLEPALATADFYLANTPTDGIPYWDTGAPGLALMDDPLGRPADPFNEHEPVDSSAAAIAAQGLVRLGHWLAADPARSVLAAGMGAATGADGYLQAGLTVAARLLEEPYLATDPEHEGLLLHGVYHRPNGWDHVPPGRSVPCGESCQWGDYHVRELVLLVGRLASGGPYPTFAGSLPQPAVTA